MPLIPYYRRGAGYPPGDFPVSDIVVKSAKALPMHAGLSEMDQEQVAKAMSRALRS